jgi:hypothetical protein
MSKGGSKVLWKTKTQTKLVLTKVFAFNDHSKENLTKFDYMSSSKVDFFGNPLYFGYILKP